MDNVLRPRIEDMNNEPFLTPWDANLAKGDMTDVALAVIC
jgi:hypothetical protein